MKPVVGAMQAWSCTVISAFAIIILGTLGLLFNKNHPELVGGVEDPEDGKTVAATAGTAIIIYAEGGYCAMSEVLRHDDNYDGGGEDDE
ncbi:hypothetical protein SMACR_04899 [Sordaria macrospora]|uniref:WGS project CABT00000000 data, contig 2.1 n=2 Tax=Sordaria macrospora TaxID=5147 RepID=F7VLX8_SORMK|nr:uncharacterized protein SMAC_04899 [Sordaria macrospora k-hell]KAA8630881.1 hypothetical protein SMACR_04899 [Sordaria macrospora]CCC06506.1 unnamed protein product [Sordaria macrospora k-hell]